jgi:hypothetical protein
MKIDSRILAEIKNYNRINKYLQEQEAEAVPEPEGGDLGDVELGGGDAQASDLGGDLGGGDLGGTENQPDEIPEPVDIDNDPDVEEVGAEGTPQDDGGTEELDITDLVNKQKEIGEKQDEYMDTMFNKLEELTQKLSYMDQILSKINSLEDKVEKYRQKTPEEKLQLRSLDSYPYNQKLSDFFVDKTEEMEKSGKNEYVLTDDEVQNFTPSDIKKTFDAPISDEKKFPKF